MPVFAYSRCAIVGLLLLTASCAAPKSQPRAQLAPPLQLDAPLMSVDRLAAQAGRADRDQSKATTQASPSGSGRLATGNPGILGKSRQVGGDGWRREVP